MTHHVALTEDQLCILKSVSLREGRPVEEIVQTAIKQYLETELNAQEAVRQAAFGAWGEGEDGLAYQNRLREEW